MPRKLRIIPAEGETTLLEVILQKFTMEDLYGKKIVEKRTTSGELLSQVSVTLDGTHILVEKSTSSQYIDENGLYISEVIPTDKEGKPLPITNSMFKDVITLSQTITLEEFFTIDVSKTYVLNSEGDMKILVDRCQKLLGEKKFLTFNYTYYDTAFPETAVLIPVKDSIVVAVGTPAPVLWAKLTTNLPETFTEEEAESEEEPEFGTFW